MYTSKVDDVQTIIPDVSPESFSDHVGEDAIQVVRRKSVYIIRLRDRPGYETAMGTNQFGYATFVRG